MLSVLPDAVVTNADTPVTINVLANDTGANLTITSFSNPAHGSLVFNGATSFTYAPSAGFVGDDSFSYTVRDAQGTPASAEVTISVVPNAGTTVATDDVVEVVAGGSVIVPVLTNDLAADGGALQIIAISMPGHGVVNVLPDQTIRYLPQSGFTGIDSFTYTVTDGQGSSASATVTVKVLAKNSPPVAAADTFPVEAGRPTVLAVLANDSDPDGGPLQIVGFTMPSHGSLVFNPDRTFTYTPAAGFLGQDQFTYTIRDNRSDSAVATVTLVVAEVIESPIAFGEQVTTEAGLPVTIDVLANDTLPAGQEVAIVAVTLPYRGKLAFNPDKTITYTPNAGFVGIDDFTYTISNGKTGTSKATVTVEVRLPTVENVYANGYACRRRIVLPAQGVGASTVDNVVLQVAEQGAWLKSIDQGGKVASAEGFDLRFELADGNKLDHEIETYDPVAGRLLAWIRLPSWALSSQLQLLLYYGNPAVAATEANPVGVWQGYLARWRLPAGGDATGNGRDLAGQGVITDSLIGGAARFDGNGKLTLDDTSWLGDLPALTVQAFVKADAGMIGGSARILAQGGGGSAPTGLTLGYLASTSEGVSNAIYALVDCIDGEATIISQPDQHSSEPQLIHASWQSGTAPRLHLNGSQVTPSVSQVRSGLTLDSGGPLEIGSSWQGLIDEVRITNRSLPADWIGVEARNMLSPYLSYGVSQEENVDAESTAVVAVPFNVTTDAGKGVDIDVLSSLLAPEDGVPVAVTSVGQPANGMATVVGGVVRYTPNSGFSGNDQFTYKISDGRTQGTGRIAVRILDTVSQGQSTPGVNLLVNSKLTGSTAAIADGWANRWPGEGAVTFTEASTEGHRKVRLQSTGDSDRAAIEQTYLVRSGERYVFSAYVAAVGDAADPSRVILNHAPFNNANVLGGATARPTLGSLSAGTRVSYILDATVDSNIKIILGLDGAGDVTLERPMFDKADKLRAYTATGYTASPTPSVYSTGIGVPYKSDGMMPLVMKWNNYSAVLCRRAPKTGTITALGFECASNNAGDYGDPPLPRAKSAGTGNFTLNLDLTVGKAPVSGDGLDRQLALSGGLELADVMFRPDFSKILRSGSITHNRATNTGDGDRRRWHVWTLPTPLAVTSGERLCLVGYAKSSNAENDYISYTNSPTMSPSSSVRLVGPWDLMPRRTYSPREGFESFGMILKETGSYTSNKMNKLYVRVPQHGQLTFYYDDGEADGMPLRESNGLTSQLRVGGNNWVRERFRHLGATFTSRYIWLPCYWDTNGGIPTASLTVTLIDETTSARWATSAAAASSGTNTVSTVRGYDGGTHAANNFPDFTRFDLGAARTITSGHDFRIELSSADGSRLYKAFGGRHCLTAYDKTDAPPPPTTGLPARVGQSNPSVLSFVERSTDGGNSWSRLTLYTSNRTDLSLSFWLQPE